MDARPTAACAPTADTQRPTTPSNLTLNAASRTSMTIGWTASTDNVGVVGYDEYRGPAQVGSTTTTSTTYSGLTCGTRTFSASTRPTLPATTPHGPTFTASTASCADSGPDSAGEHHHRHRGVTSISLTWVDSSDDVGVTGVRALSRWLSCRLDLRHDRHLHGPHMRHELARSGWTQSTPRATVPPRRS